MSGLAVAALEVPHRFGDVAGSLRLVEALLARAEEVDLVLLPELAITGYVSPQGDFDLTRFAEPVDGPTAQALANLARTRGVALAAPLVERDGERLFNTLLLFDREGRRVAHYRKRNPWYPEEWATPGDLGTPVVQLGDVKLALSVCFDLHFLPDIAKAELGEADALLFSSAWVEDEPRADSRTQLLGQLARTFGVWVVNANWGVGQPRVPGQGASRIVDPSGREVARAQGPGLVQARVTPKSR